MDGISPEKALPIVIEQAKKLKEFAEQANQDRKQVQAELALAIEELKSFKSENHFLKNENRVYKQQMTKSLTITPDAQEHKDIVEHNMCQYGKKCTRHAEGKCAAYYHCAYDIKLTEEERIAIPQWQMRNIQMINGLSNSSRRISPVKPRNNSILDTNDIIINNGPVARRKLSITDDEQPSQEPIAPPPGFETKPLFYNKQSPKKEQNQALYPVNGFNYNQRQDGYRSDKFISKDPTYRHDLF